MSIFKEIPPTAGFPLYAKDFLQITKAKGLEDRLKTYLGLNYAKITYSGTAALYIILEALKELSSKTTVIIPSFVCPLVPLAIKKAGLKVEVCDVRPDSFDFDYSQLEKTCLENRDILAIVAVHLAGIPLDFENTEKIAKKFGIFTVEDCAQSLGAEYKEKKVGALGDFSFFSLCRGKGLTIYEGGVLATKENIYAKILDRKIKLLEKDNLFSETLKILELFGYWIFYRPFLFWFVFCLPQNFWNLFGNKLKALSEYYTVSFSMHKVSGIRKSIGLAQFNRLEDEIKKQRDKAQFYLDNLKEIKGAKSIKEEPQTRATYPYLTLIFDEPKMCDKARKLFSAAGLGVSWVYGYAICDYDYLKSFIPRGDCQNGRELARRTITLSTSTFLSQKQLSLIVKKIKDL